MVQHGIPCVLLASCDTCAFVISCRDFSYKYARLHEISLLRTSKSTIHLLFNCNELRFAKILHSFVAAEVKLCNSSKDHYVNYPYLTLHSCV